MTQASGSVQRGFVNPLLSPDGPIWLDGTVLQFDKVVPAARVYQRQTGAPVRVTDYRQRLALVLCFLHAGCELCASYAAQLEALSDEVASAGAAVRVVLPAEDRDQPHIGLPVWTDTDDRARVKLLGEAGEAPCVLVLDRYAAAQESHPAPDHDFPPAGDIVGTLNHLAALCPECGPTRP